MQLLHSSIRASPLLHLLSILPPGDQTSMPTTLAIGSQELATGKATLEHLQSASRALHGDGILILENIFNAEHAAVTVTRGHESCRGQALFDTWCPLRLGPLVAHLAGSRLGSSAVYFRHQRCGSLKNGLDSVRTLQRNVHGNPQIHQLERHCQICFFSKKHQSVPISALAVTVILRPAKLRVLSADASISDLVKVDAHDPHHHTLQAGTVLIWDMEQCNLQLSTDIARKRKTLDSVLETKDEALVFETALGMRNFRCFHCGVFNLSTESHIKTCAANNAYVSLKRTLTIELPCLYNGMIIGP